MYGLNWKFTLDANKSTSKGPRTLESKLNVLGFSFHSNSTLCSLESLSAITLCFPAICDAVMKFFL